MGVDYGFYLHEKNVKDADIKTKEQYNKVYTSLLWTRGIGNVYEKACSAVGDPGYKKTVYIAADTDELERTNKDEYDSCDYVSLNESQMHEIVQKLEPVYKFLMKYSSRIIDNIYEYNTDDLTKKERKELDDKLYDAFELEYEDVYGIILVYETFRFLLRSDFFETYGENKDKYEIVVERNY